MSRKGIIPGAYRIRTFQPFGRLGLFLFGNSNLLNNFRGLFLRERELLTI